MLDQSRARALHTALAALPERQAQAVRLRHLDNLTNPEIAQIMGLSVEAVESLTARVNARFRHSCTGKNCVRI